MRNSFVPPKARSDHQSADPGAYHCPEPPDAERPSNAGGTDFSRVKERRSGRKHQCAPEWIDCVGNPATIADLYDLAAIGWWSAGAIPKWRIRSGDGVEHMVPIKPHFRTNNLAVAQYAALDGLGMARLPRPICRPHMQAGRLGRVIADCLPDAMAIYIVYPTRRSLTPAGQLFPTEVEKALLLFGSQFE